VALNNRALLFQEWGRFAFSKGDFKENNSKIPFYLIE